MLHAMLYTRFKNSFEVSCDPERIKELWIVYIMQLCVSKLTVYGSGNLLQGEMFANLTSFLSKELFLNLEYYIHNKIQRRCMDPKMLVLIFATVVEIAKFIKLKD